MSNLRLDVAELERAIVNLLVTYPELAEDETLRADMLEGLTDIDEVLAVLVDKQREAKSMAAAVAARMDDLRTRKGRYERQHEAFRDLTHKIMERANIRSRTLPEATLSISFRKPEPIVEDEAKLPDECIKIVRTADKSTIKEWCKAGNIPEGVRMSNGRDILQVRPR